jgi:hypothetical protein
MNATADQQLGTHDTQVCPMHRTRPHPDDTTNVAPVQAQLAGLAPSPVSPLTRAAVAVADFTGTQTYRVRFSRGDSGRAIYALAEIGALVESGRFTLPAVRTFPLADVTQAHRAGESGQVRAKLVLLPCRSTPTTRPSTRP